MIMSEDWIGSSIVMISLTLLIIRYIVNNISIDRKIPSIQGGYPFFGQVFDMIKGSPWDTMTKWSNDPKLGGIYRIHLFGSNALCISDPDLIKQVFHTKLSIFKKDVQWTYKPFLDILGNGLVTSEGKDWRRQRVLLSSHLRIDILDNIPSMALKAFHRLKVKLDKARKENSIVEMAEEFRHLTLQVIAEALLSLSPEESDQTFAKMYLPIVQEGNARTWNPERMYIPTTSWFQHNYNVKVLNDYVTSLIEKRWQLRLHEQDSSVDSSVDKNNCELMRPFDVLDKILHAVPVENWNKQTIKQVRDEIKTFVLAGHETSASMLTWTLYELSIHPELLQIVKKEANDVLKDYINDNNSDILTLPARTVLSEKLVYSECCLRESLRKYSNVPSVVRVASKATHLGDYYVPQGMTIMVNLQGVHHNPSYWENPLLYDPSRFLPENYANIKEYTFLPFIDGPRMCLGQYLSLLETKIVLSLLVVSYEFEVVDRQLAGEKHPFMVPIIPKHGHYMKIK